MRRAATSIGTLLAGFGLAGAAVPPAAAADAYPAVAVLDAFKTACTDLSSLEAAGARVAANGWVHAANPDSTPVGALVRFGREAGAKMVEGRGRMVGDPAVYSRTVSGETLYLVLSRVELDGKAVTGCRAYDVDEPRKIAAADATRWAGRAPDNAIDQPALTRLTWEPGLVPGQDSFEIYHVPAGSPVIAVTKLAGIALKADLVGTIQR